MGKKDKKKDTAAKQARAAKQAKKLEKGEKKGNKDDAEDPEDDIDAILLEIREREEAKTSVRVFTTIQPSPRSNFSLTPLPNGDMLMFGGEFCDGTCTTVFNDVLRWNIDKREWKQIESLNTPPPRCSHQAVYFNEKLYVFGGEYATLDQFHHYRDLWRFNPKTQSWTEIHPSGDLPTARSGHRMCVWRGYMVLFGGFYEQKRDMQWFNDTYIYSFQEEKWHQVHHKPLAHLPRVRSGHQMIVSPSDDCIFLYGGFSKEKMALQKQGQPMDSSRKEAHIHDDLWILDLKSVIGLTNNAAGDTGKEEMTKEKVSAQPGFDADKAVWSKLSRKGLYPSTRCGAVMTKYKSNKAVLFGGVYDEDAQAGHKLRSVFYSDIYNFDMNTRRWFEVSIDNSNEDAAEKATATMEETEDDGAGDDNAGDISTVLMQLEHASLNLTSVNLAESGSIGRYFNRHYSHTPCPRINPCVFVRGSKMYIYGGVTELEDVEVTLDDCWYTDLSKRDSWHQVLPGTMHSFVWKGVIDNATEGTVSDDEGEMDGDGDGYGEVFGTHTEDCEDASEGEGADGEKDSDKSPHNGDCKVSAIEPMKGESLREFYNRTTDHWITQAEQQVSAGEVAVQSALADDATDKEKTKRKKIIKTKAFVLAEERYNTDA